jgi:hypothetical protein
MSAGRQTATSRRAALFCIWTLLHQRRLAVLVGRLAWSLSVLLTLLAVSGRVAIVPALNALGLAGASLVLFIWLFLQARKRALLGIREPALRRLAHQAMLVNICARSAAACPYAIAQPAPRDRSQPEQEH